MAVSIRRGMFLPSQIPTATMADIAFLLLIFFLTTTIFRIEEGLAVELPSASAADRIARQQAVHVWIGRDGRLVVGDREVAVGSLGAALVERARGAQIHVNLQADRAVPCGMIHEVLVELRRANLRNLSFGTRAERGVPWRIRGGHEGTQGGVRP